MWIGGGGSTPLTADFVPPVHGRVVAALSDLVDFMAWNLGIAATALGDWAAARRAWRTFGVDVDGGEQAPIRMNFGTAPIRLNPDPRFWEEELLVDGVRYDTEVVWARRLCPTRAEIESVPFPESGHRFGDVVLHDGDPVGERRYGDQVRGVFNEIAFLERSPWATLRTEVPAVDDDALGELSDLFSERGYAAECWARSAQILCKACSEGAVGAQHDHEVGEEPARRETSLVIGLGAPREEADRLLDVWVAAGGERTHGPVEPGPHILGPKALAPLATDQSLGKITLGGPQP